MKIQVYSLDGRGVQLKVRSEVMLMKPVEKVMRAGERAKQKRVGGKLRGKRCCMSTPTGRRKRRVGNTGKTLK